MPHLPATDEPAHAAPHSRPWRRCWWTAAVDDAGPDRLAEAPRPWPPLRLRPCDVTAGPSHAPAPPVRPPESPRCSLRSPTTAGAGRGGGFLRQPGPHRQDRRGPVQRLDLRLFVDTDHHRLVGRV